MLYQLSYTPSEADAADHTGPAAGRVMHYIPAVCKRNDRDWAGFRAETRAVEAAGSEDWSG